ncbi:hypothetical protein ACT3CD_13095 [Geofilum sp. OHC36d9]|uniref:hypothetical protein n=1 Tax=Geofilum sp. OHC36d9 TaxID=3458413 RepID=UPI00403372BA
MDWPETLISIKSGGQSKYFSSYLQQHPEELPELIKTISHSEPKIAWRAAWVVDNLARNKRHLVEPYLSQLTNIVLKTSHHGVHRHITNILRMIDPADIDNGHLVDTCFHWMTNSNTPVALQANAMEIIANLCTIYPELANELVSIIDAGYEMGSPGYRSRATKILKKLRK